MIEIESLLLLVSFVAMGWIIYVGGYRNKEF
jgi:hypothetical protein